MGQVLALAEATEPHSRLLRCSLCVEESRAYWVHVDPDEPAGYYVEEVIEGTTIAQALTSVQYDELELKRRMKSQIDAAIKSDRLKPSEGMRLLDEYERGLKDYTYLSIQ